MKCNECGSTGITSSSCPDCGSDNIAEEIGAGTSNPIAAAAPAPAVEPNPNVMMPVVDMAAGGKGPVLGTIKLPDGTMVELFAGETFSVAHETSDQDPTYRITGDDTVSGTPIKVSADNRTVTGGGSSGFALDFTIRFKPETVVELPKDLSALLALLHAGDASFTATALKVGKSTRFPLKF